MISAALFDIRELAFVEERDFPDLESFVAAHDAEQEATARDWTTNDAHWCWHCDQWFEGEGLFDNESGGHYCPEECLTAGESV